MVNLYSVISIHHYNLNPTRDIRADNFLYNPQIRHEPNISKQRPLAHNNNYKILVSLSLIWSPDPDPMDPTGHGHRYINYDFF
jgi:hypothetical protein